MTGANVACSRRAFGATRGLVKSTCAHRQLSDISLKSCVGRHRVVGGRSSVQEGFCKNLVMEGRSSLKSSQAAVGLMSRSLPMAYGAVHDYSLSLIRICWLFWVAIMFKAPVQPYDMTLERSCALPFLVYCTLWLFMYPFILSLSLPYWFNSWHLQICPSVVKMVFPDSSLYVCVFLCM